MSEWKEYLFKEVAWLNYGKSLPERDRKDGIYPVYGSGGIVGYHEKPYVKSKGLVIGRKGSVGTVYLSKKPFYPIDTVYYIDEIDKHHQFEFFYYYVQKLGLENFNNDAAVPGLNRNLVHKLKIKLPPLPTQRRIAAILSAYDELIETNNCRIKILEQMAEQIYKEWFVRIRFPGHEKAVFVKGVPKGWGWKKVEEIFKTSSGGTPSRQKEQEYFNGKINWIKTGELKDSFILESEEKITESGLKNSSAKLFPPFTLLMAMYGVNIGQLGISVQPSSANQAICVFTPKQSNDYSLYYSFFYFKSIRSHLFNISMGAAQQNLSQDIIKRLNFFHPDSNILLKFDKIQKPIFDLKLKLELQNQNLKQTRDLLLPRLISGKLRVEN